MIELAPEHKLGLPLDNPVMLAAGSVGYGEAVHRDMVLGRFGAVVVGPLTHRSRGGRPPPRLAETVGGFVRDIGLQNRGVAGTVKGRVPFARLWARAGCPVMVQIADTAPAEVTATVRLCSHINSCQGFELLCQPQASASEIAQLVESFTLESDLPLLVKLPLAQATTLAPAAIVAGAAGLVVGSPPLGAAVRADGQMISGETFGPGLFPVMLAALLAVKALNLPGSLVACGGIHTAQQARHCLAAGADALQLDSLVWVEPAAAMAMVEALGQESWDHSSCHGTAHEG